MPHDPGIGPGAFAGARKAAERRAMRSRCTRMVPIQSPPDRLAHRQRATRPPVQTIPGRASARWQPCFASAPPRSDAVVAPRHLGAPRPVAVNTRTDERGFVACETAPKSYVLSRSCVFLPIRLSFARLTLRGCVETLVCASTDGCRKPAEVVFELATSQQPSVLMPRCRDHAHALRITLASLIRPEHWSEIRVTDRSGRERR
jgi:hypothetical protein